MNLLEELISENSKVLSNLKKSSRALYTFETLLTKLNELKLRKQKFNQILKGITVEDSKLLDLKLKFKAGTAILEGHIWLQLGKQGYSVEDIQQDGITEELETSLPNLQENFIMADFSLETAIKIIPIFDGKYKELEPFLTIVELRH